MREHPWRHPPGRRRNDQGQVSILFALILVIVMVFIAGIAIAGRVAVERARARTAADSVALAAADPVAQRGLVDRWADLGAQVDGTTDSAHATAGRAQARAWVRPTNGSVTRSPALVAIISRAEQILGGPPLVPLSWQGNEFVLAPDDAVRFDVLVTDFALCSTPVENGGVAYAICHP